MASGPASPLVFISYRVTDTKQSAARLFEDLQRELEVGEVFLDRQSIDGGQPWPDSIRDGIGRAQAVLILVGHRWLEERDQFKRRRLDLENDWVRQEVAAALRRQPAALVVPVLIDNTPPIPPEALSNIPDIVDFASIQGIPLRLERTEDWHHDLSQLLRLLEPAGFRRRALGTGSAAASEPARLTWNGSPFPGLRAFTRDDGPIFFGRHREAEQLVDQLREPSRRFVVVVGASGSGKSSLVAAGLLPRLVEGAVDGSSAWLLPRVVPAEKGEGVQWAGLRFTPRELTDNPFDMLAAKLAPLLPDERTVPSVKTQLETDATEISTLVELALRERPPRAEVLLFVDQLEELFADAVTDRHRDAFVRLLVQAAQTPRLHTVATIRGDFYDRCLKYPALVEVLRGGTFPLAAPTGPALIEMMTGPARCAGLTFEPGLLDRIWTDTGTEPGGLPLLASALDELYQGRKADGTLTHDAYAAFGGVKQAIGRRADRTLVALPPDARAELYPVLLKLIDVDERGVATRRRAQRDDLVGAAETRRVLVDAFVGARLLIADRDVDDHPVITVAHEALFREWRPLADWIVKRTDGIRLWRHAQSAAAEWMKSGHDPSHLWPHERLVFVDQAMTQIGVDRGRLDEPVKSFVRREADRLIEELANPRTTHYRRAEIGDRLDRIGDLRPGVGVRHDGAPDVVWCQISGGTVELEGVEGIFDVRTFHAAKYPITYRQYRAFLDDPQGYRNNAHWKGLVHEAQHGEQFRPLDNCPAENVSWYDAMAFCRWLSTRVGFEVRLPHEAEWQQAATGGQPHNIYPWGPEWVDGIANTTASRLSRITAVGMYPDGVSGQGVFDLAGNVWEWCMNSHDKPRVLTPDRKVGRVLRGGSWDDSQGFARASSRDRHVPGDRDNRIGFRVVCVSPIP